jgi:hypothetical protein
MGSMLEIMKKVRDEGDAPDPAVEGVVELMPEEAARGGPAAADSRTTQSEPGAVSDLVAEAASVAFPRTQEWDAKLMIRRWWRSTPVFGGMRAVQICTCEAAEHEQRRRSVRLGDNSSVPGEGKSTCTLNLGW